MYFSEALQNLIENKRYIIAFLFFLVISFTGIAVTDSLIYSTSKKAEEELSLNGHNIITVEFEEKVSDKKAESLFRNSDYELVKNKKMVYSVGLSPWSEEPKMVMGTEKQKLGIWKLDNAAKFEGNVILYHDEKKSVNVKRFFLNGIPFKAIGQIESKKTEFLDSLGLSTLGNNVNYVIPLDTLLRLTLDDSISSIDLVKKTSISDDDIVAIKEILLKGNIRNFSVQSPLDAKLAVEKVLNRFGLLTNSIYTLLTIMMLVIIVIICRKTFQSRSTEFALKIIHGIDKTIITRTVIIELIIITFIGLCIAMIVTLIMTYILSLLLGVTLLFRPVMISLSFILVVSASYVSGLHAGNYFFKQNPIELIKNRRL